MWISKGSCAKAFDVPESKASNRHERTIPSLLFLRSSKIGDRMGCGAKLAGACRRNAPALDVRRVGAPHSLSIAHRSNCRHALHYKVDENPNTHEPVLVNIIGHSAGAIIFGIFLYLLLRDRPAARLRGSWRTLAAAALAFLWNLGSLAALIVNTRTHAEPQLLLAVAFSILSVLPAVLLDLSLANRL